MLAVTRGEEFGPYMVYEQIGTGGMASVHRAETSGIEGFSRPVALKRMLPHVAANDDLVQSFVREARLASYLRHANVAQTYDLGKVGDVYFIAMELVPGRNLREILRHCLRTGTRVPIPITLNILNQICDALDYAHNLADESGNSLGIIHRDVSPSNVILAETGVVKLIDFGIAKASAAGMQTMSGVLKGKFGYMAPEYLEGAIDTRADLFALGVIAHELLTNRPLFGRGDDLDTLYRVKSMPIDPPSQWNPGVPPEIDDIVMTALERDPNERWQRASALRQALTTETQRLGLTVLDRQVVDWCEQAFTGVGVDTPTAVLDRPAQLSADPSIVIEREVVDDAIAAHETATANVRAADTLMEMQPLRRADEPRRSQWQTPPVVGAAPLRPPAPLRTIIDPAPMHTIIDRPAPPFGGAARDGALASDRPAPPAQLPLTGSRTRSMLPARTMMIEADDVLAEAEVAAPASSSSAVPIVGVAHAAHAPRPRTGPFAIALAMLAIAAASGAVVYFGLPYLQ